MVVVVVVVLSVVVVDSVGVKVVVVDSVVGSLDETVDVVLASTYNIQKSIC